MNIAIYIYDDAEVLDFSGPFEVFSTAARLQPDTALFDVFLVAESEEPVIARNGYSVNPAFNFENHPPIDVLIVAGGVHMDEMKKPQVIDWVSNNSARADLVASVCTGAFILAEAGLLNGLSVTTHWEDIPDLRSDYPALTVVESVRWVDQGAVVTSGGISAGIDMSLHLVEKLAGRDLAVNTARQMDFEWTENS